jgi:hypothetical protein
MNTTEFSHVFRKNARTTLLSPRHLRRGDDPPDEIPPDVLAGYRRHAGFLLAEHPERAAAYRRRLGEAIDELRQAGKPAAARVLAAFEAMLRGAGGPR